MSALEVPEGWESVTDDNQLIKTISKEGEGWKKPQNGAKVSVHYTGRLVSNGEKFDSSLDRDSPFEFKLGAGAVIKGWDKGVPTMKKGEKATFRMSPDYGYGANGSAPKIPGNAELEFDIELLSWSAREDITSGKRGIMKKVLQSAEGYTKPNDCSKVEIAYSCKVDGKVVDENDSLKFTVGEEQVPGCLEKCVKNLVLNEQASFKVTPEFGFGPEGCPEKNIPPNATIDYTVKLNSLEREKETWKMEKDEKLVYAEQKKDQGNDFFQTRTLLHRRKTIRNGIECYSKCF